ncbi:MAG TPA: trypsin-like peptidase domain-containing protein [Candidatus Pacearchaeota archaeon]|nr:trypsin-like peptidase domain-containing protein [Candidatus Pacearchaeota archaeon]
MLSSFKYDKIMPMIGSPVKKIAKKVCPAVITIVASKDIPKLDAASFLSLQGNLDLNHKGQARVGGGSGFIVSKDGYVFTCAHVVKDFDADYTVIIDPKHKYAARVLSRDSLTDIAILKIKGASFPYLKLANSDKVELGQYAISIGNSLGEFEDTISLGIISGLSRNIKACDGMDFHTDLKGLFQTDAAINNGNSGGPLINIKGEAIGINTAMIEKAQNIGFAIPINCAIKDLKEIKKHGKIKRPYLGIKYVLLDKHLSEENDLPVSEGALVVRERYGENPVAKGSPADKAGLKEYDIVVSFGNKLIDKNNTLAEYLSRSKVNDRVELQILRKGKLLKKVVILQEKR